MQELNKEAFEKSIAYLKTIDEDQFDMHWIFATKKGRFHHALNFDDIKSECGAVACALGHIAGLLPEVAVNQMKAQIASAKNRFRNNPTDLLWNKTMRWLNIDPYCMDRDDMDSSVLAGFMFNGGWRFADNTAEGAAARMQAVLDGFDYEAMSRAYIALIDVDENICEGKDGFEDCVVTLKDTMEKVHFFNSHNHPTQEYEMNEKNVKNRQHMLKHVHAALDAGTGGFGTVSRDWLKALGECLTSYDTMDKRYRDSLDARESLRGQTTALHEQNDALVREVREAQKAEKSARDLAGDLQDQLDNMHSQSVQGWVNTWEGMETDRADYQNWVAMKKKIRQPALDRESNLQTAFDAAQTSINSLRTELTEVHEKVLDNQREYQGTLNRLNIVTRNLEVADACNRKDQKKIDDLQNQVTHFEELANARFDENKAANELNIDNMDVREIVEHICQESDGQVALLEIVRMKADPSLTGESTSTCLEALCARPDGRREIAEWIVFNYQPKALWDITTEVVAHSVAKLQELNTSEED